ncbi:hypothetical protein B0H13DRAFT_2317213 [Mycena leptocephala]|nr:hypothetical protein B0H13DRAFT_2317213 [Mycena leptocephala]
MTAPEDNSASHETMAETSGVSIQNGSPLDFWVYLNGLPVEKKQQLSAQILVQRQAEDAELHALEQQRCKLAADLRSEDTT